MRPASLRSRYIPQNATEVADSQSDAVVYLYTNARGLPTVVAYHGKSTKRDFHFYYNTVEKRDAAVQKFFERRRARAKMMADRKAERSKPHTLEIGHILSSSFGYDQTNVYFYEVTAIIGKNTVELREVAKIETETLSMQGTCVPAMGQYVGSPIRKRVNANGVRISSCEWASIWNGLPKRWSAYA
jgi:hypothetical protein